MVIRIMEGTNMKQGMLGAFRELDATCAAIEELKKKTTVTLNDQYFSK